MVTRSNLHARPRTVAQEIDRRVKRGPVEGQSRRAWGRELAELVCELALTNVEPRHFARYVPDWVVAAIARQRTINHLASCGIVSVSAKSLPTAA